MLVPHGMCQAFATYTTPRLKMCSTLDFLESHGARAILVMPKDMSLERSRWVLSFRYVDRLVVSIVQEIVSRKIIYTHP